MRADAPGPGRGLAQGNCGRREGWEWGGGEGEAVGECLPPPSLSPDLQTRLELGKGVGPEARCPGSWPGLTCIGHVTLASGSLPGKMRPQRDGPRVG